eukprot:UN00564
MLEDVDEKVCLEIGDQLIKHKYIKKEPAKKNFFENSASTYFRFDSVLLDRLNAERQKLKGDRSHWGITENLVEVLIGDKWVTREITDRNELRT